MNNKNSRYSRSLDLQTPNNWGNTIKNKGFRLSDRGHFWNDLFSRMNFKTKRER